MSIIKVKSSYLLRKDTAENWQDKNPILSKGEQGLETDTGIMKIGDGVTAFNSLSDDNIYLPKSQAINFLKAVNIYFDKSNSGLDSDNVQDAIDEVVFKLGSMVRPESWADVQKVVRMGLASKVFTIGDQLTCKRGSDTLVWDIIGIDCDTPSDSKFTHSITLGLHDCLAGLQFDAREALFYCQDGLAAGTYNFKVTQHNFVSSDVNKTFQFTLTQAVPAGGQIVLQVSYNVTIAGSTLKTYASASATTEIETATITEGTGGTSLGDVNNTINGNTNSLQRGLIGNNRYSVSAMRQYLNSSAAAGSVWTPKHNFDRAPSWATSTAGFLNGMDEDFLSVIGEVTKVTALNTVSDGGGSETTTERFFLLSRSEVYGGNEVMGGEGAAYPYYANYSDLAAPGTGNDTNRIKYRNGSAQYWWLRSPYAGNASTVRRVHTTGYVYDNFATNDYGVAPACCII